MIIFKNIDIEGFGIFAKPLSFSLDRPGINILALKNGSGKSTLFGALVWVLYGKTLKDKSTVATYPHLRPETWKGTKVTLLFKKDNSRYEVTRCLDWTGKIQGEKGRNKVFITIDGEPFQELKDKRSSTQFIESLVGYSYELFTNTVVFPQKAKRFIEERGVDKRKIFEEVFNLDWIGNTLALAKDKKRDQEVRVTKQRGLVSQTESEIKSLQSFIDKIEESRKEFEQEKKVTISNLEAKLKSLEDSIDKTPDESFMVAATVANLEKEVATLEESFSQSEYDSLTKRVDRAEQLNSQATNRKMELKESLKSLAEQEHPTCPTCNQPLPDRNLKTIEDAYRLELDDLEVKSQENNKLYAKLRTQLTSLKGVSKQYKTKSLELNQLKATLYQANEKALKQEQIWERVKQLEREIEVENKRTFKDISKDMKVKVNARKKELLSYNKELRTSQRELEILQWAISTPLSEAGIKSFLINSMIALLNQRLSEYSQYINFEVKLEVDMDRARKDIYTTVNREGYPVLLEDLSGGETQLVNIVVTFGLYDLIQSLSGNTETNLQVFDEVFESLDPGNVEIVSDLIQQCLGKTRSIFIITHKKNFSIRNSNNLTL